MRSRQAALSKVFGKEWVISYKDADQVFLTLELHPEDLYNNETMQRDSFINILAGTPFFQKTLAQALRAKKMAESLDEQLEDLSNRLEFT